jgi:hypothetical protein
LGYEYRLMTCDAIEPHTVSQYLYLIQHAHTSGLQIASGVSLELESLDESHWLEFTRCALMFTLNQFDILDEGSFNTHWNDESYYRHVVRVDTHVECNLFTNIY